MTERQAWLELAKSWEGDVLLYRTIVFIQYRGCEPCGLCPCIEALEDDREISPEIAESMIAKLPDAVENNFCWPPTPEGAKQRAEFCRRQAAKLTKPTKKKGKK